MDPSDVDQIDEVLLRFDRCWNRNGVAEIESFLPDDDIAVRMELLRELVKVDMEYRWRLAERVTAGEYLSRFSELDSDPLFSQELIEEEFRNRARFGESLTDGEIADRFPDQVDELRQLRDGISIESQIASDLRKTLAPRPSMLNQSNDSPGAGLDETVRVVNNRYEIREKKGSGAFADVYLAWDKTLQRETALKISRISLDTHPELGDRFYREAQAGARLLHPGVVAVYEVGETGRQLFIAQEFLTGGTLEDRCQRGLLPVDETVRLMISICEAVDYAHRCGVVHRDLKPANILIDQHGSPRVADFGLAVQSDVASRLTRDGELLGTPAYMSPEQATGDSSKIHAATDIYSLGVMLYQMLTGQLPFTGSTASVLRQIVEVEPIRLRQHNPAVPRELQTICLKAMSKSAGHRYASARDLAEDLGRYLHQEPIRAKPVGTVGRLALWMRRNPTEAITIGLATLLLTVVLAISVSNIAIERNRFREQRDIANSALLEALINDADNQLRIKGDGWWDQAQASIRKAAAIVTTEEDRFRLRGLAAEMLVDPSLRLIPVGHQSFSGTIEARPEATGRPVEITAVKAWPGRELFFVGFSDGRLEMVSPGSDNAVLKLTGLSESIDEIEFDPSRLNCLALSGGEVWSWTVPDTLVPGPAPITVAGKKWLRDSVAAIALSHDGQKLAYGNTDGEIRTVEVSGTGALEQIPDSVQFDDGHTDNVIEICFSADNTQLATSGLDRRLIFWNTSTGRQVYRWMSADPPRSLVFDPTGRDLYYSTYESYTLKRIRASESPIDIVMLTGPVMDLRLMPDGVLISAAKDGRLSLWRGARPECDLTGLGLIRCMDYDHQSRMAVAGLDGGRMRFWKVESSESILRFPTQHAIDMDERGRLFDPSSIGQLVQGEPARGREILQVLDQNTAAAMAVGRNQSLAAIVNSESQVSVLNRGEQFRFQLADTVGPASIDISQDDVLLAAFGSTGRGQIWRLDNRASLAEFSIPTGQPGNVCFGSNQKLFVFTETGIYRIDEKGQPTPEAECANPLRLASAENGSVAYCHDPRTVRLVGDSALPETVREFDHSSPLIQLKISRDASRLFTLCDDRSIRVWDTESGQVLVQRRTSVLYDRLCLDPRGEFLLVGNLSDSARLLNAITLSDVIAIRFVQRHQSFNFDGSILWHAGNGMFELARDTIDQQCEANTNAHSADARFDAGFSQVIDGGHMLIVWSVDVSPDGQLLATSAYDGMVKIWDCDTGALLKTLPLHNTPVWRVAFSTDGKILATGNEPVEDEVSEVVLWDTATWQELLRIPASTRMVSGLAFHPQRPWLAMGMADGALKIVDMNTGKVVHQLSESGGSVMDVVFSPDGGRLAAACIQDGLKVFDVSGDREIHDPIVAQTISWAGQHVWTVDWSRDGASLVSGDHLGVVDFYDAKSLSLKLKLPTGSTRLRYLRFGQGDRLLGGSAYVGTGFVLDLERFQDSLTAMQLE